MKNAHTHKRTYMEMYYTQCSIFQHANGLLWFLFDIFVAAPLYLHLAHTHVCKATKAVPVLKLHCVLLVCMLAVRSTDEEIAVCRI